LVSPVDKTAICYAVPVMAFKVFGLFQAGKIGLRDDGLRPNRALDIEQPGGAARWLPGGRCAADSHGLDRAIQFDDRDRLRECEQIADTFGKRCPQPAMRAPAAPQC